MSVLQIKLLGLNESEEKKFIAVLALAEFSLDHLWEVTDADTADYYLLHQTLQVSGYDYINSGKYIYYQSDRDFNDTNNYIAFDCLGVPLIESLITCLNAKEASRALEVVPDKEVDTNLADINSVETTLVEVHQPITYDLNSSEATVTSSHHALIQLRDERPQYKTSVFEKIKNKIKGL